MSPLNSTVVAESQEQHDMYQSLKGRLRKPSAKMLESITSPEKSPSAAGSVVAAPTPKPTVIPTAAPLKPRYLALQSGVAEVVFSDPTEPSEVEARDSAVTVESVPTNEWHLYGWVWQEKLRVTKAARRAPVARKTTESTTSGASPVAKKSSTRPKPSVKLDEPLVEEKDEFIDNLATDDQSIVAKSETNENIGDDDSQSDSGSPEESRLASPAEGGVKRKRGRPFKGQEKPIEERLMIETTKIRRLIDDIMRKGNADSEYCLRLRNIARDLDEVMAMNIVTSSSPLNGPAEEQPSDMLPETIDSIPPQQETTPEATSVIENL